MKDFKIENKIYKIPTTWEDLTLKKFLQIRDHESLVNKMSLFEYNLEFLSIITEIEREDLLELSPDEINNLIKELLEVTTKGLELINEPIYTIDDITYVLDKNTIKMSIGQFIDLDRETKEGDVWDNAHKICASFMRPARITNFNKMFKKHETCENYVIDKYDYDELVKNSQIFYQKMPMTYIYTCVTFFFYFSTKYYKTI